MGRERREGEREGREREKGRDGEVQRMLHSHVMMYMYVHTSSCSKDHPWCCIMSSNVITKLLSGYTPAKK